MDILFFTIPLAFILAIVFVVAFIISVKDGQYDDLDTPVFKMLLEDKVNTNKKDSDQ